MVDFKYHALIVKAVDGDTVDLEIDLGFFIKIKHRIRMAEIDAEEMKSGSQKSKDAKAFLKSLEGTFIIVQSQKTDKYGRFVGTMFYENRPEKSINQEMIELGLAVKYGK